MVNILAPLLPNKGSAIIFTDQDQNPTEFPSFASSQKMTCLLHLLEENCNTLSTANARRSNTIFFISLSQLVNHMARYS